MARYFMELAYKGTNYHGWQRQPNGSSVQQVLENALSTILRMPTSITGAGRTDAGVHAKYMVAHFDAVENPFAGSPKTHLVTSIAFYHMI
jgi:tRNA pseudouridine38-40 synthase